MSVGRLPPLPSQHVTTFGAHCLGSCNTGKMVLVKLVECHERKRRGITERRHGRTMAGIGFPVPITSKRSWPDDTYPENLLNVQEGQIDFSNLYWSTFLYSTSSDSQQNNGQEKSRNPAMIGAKL